MIAQRRLQSGYYDAAPVYNTYYDHSVGDIAVSAAEGATVEIENRTAEGTRTSTYTVGAVNTTNNTVTVDGFGNEIDISTSANSTGCQNGAITVTTSEGNGGIDISAGASAGASGASATIGATECN